MNRNRWIGLTAGGLAAALAFAPAHAASIDIAMVPASPSIAPSDTLVLQVSCVGAGLTFNGFDLTISFDPTALTLLPASPVSLQEGALMTDACGNTFHVFQSAGDSAHVTDILLCSGISLTGPGTLYTLRFVAGPAARQTTVDFRHVQFYDAGLYQGPTHATGADITIGSPAGVAPGASHGLLRLRANPNPARGAVRFSLGGDPISALRVLDVTGRVVRHLPLATDTREWRWDGTDDSGANVAPGMYLAVAGHGDHAAHTRFVLLR